MDDEFDLTAELAKAETERVVAEARSAEDQLALVKGKALELARAVDIAERDRTILLRAYCDKLLLSVKDDELDRLLSSAEQSLEPATCYRKGDRLKAEEPAFLVDGLVRLGSSNIIVGQPKVGKSSFVCGLIRALQQGAESFLGKEVQRPQQSMPVLVFGTDQQESDWLYFLQKEGLATFMKQLLEPIEFFCSVDGQSQFNFTRQGVAAMAQEVAKHDFPLVVLDSLSSMMEPTGLDENLAQYAGPIRHAIKELTGLGATVVVLHHTTKRVVSWDWVEECRGSSSITSVFGWGVLARWVAAEAAETSRTDTRVAFVGKGRGKSSSGGAMGQYTDQGWQALGGLARAQAIEAVRQKEVELTNVRALVFDQVTNFHRMGQDCTAYDVANAVEKREQNVARELRKLTLLGLVVITRETPTGSRPRRHYALSEYAEALDRGEDGSGVPVEKNHLPSASSLPVERLFNSFDSYGEDGQLNQKNKKVPLGEGGSVEGPKGGDSLPVIGMSVEKLQGGHWQNGWVIKDASNLHKVEIEKLGNRLMKFVSQRWLIDIRPCTGSPFTQAATSAQAEEPEAVQTLLDATDEEDWI